MSNSTSSSLTLSDSVPIAMSALLGAVSSVANLLIFLSIAKYRALTDDKEYLLLMALALADMTNMLGNVSMRSLELLSALFDWSPLRPARQCLMQPHVTLFMLGWPLSNMMLMVISLDRFLLVAKPRYYIQLGVGYMKWVIGVTYGMAISLTLLGIWHVWLMGDELRICVGYYLAAEAEGVFKLFKVYYTETAFTAALLSVLVYAAVWPIYMSGRGKVLPSDNDQQKMRKLKSQRKMTKTLGISCLCTLLLYILPAQIADLLNTAAGRRTDMARIMWLITQMNSLANIFIYQFRHPELRVALNGLLKNKQLPINLELWPIQNN